MLLSVLAVIALGVGGINAVSNVSEQAQLSQADNKQAVVQIVEPASSVQLIDSEYDF